MSNLPRILVVTHQSVCNAHGTGAVLLRHFERYDPEKLVNVCLTDDGRPPWLCTIEARRKVPLRRWSYSWLKNGLRKRLHKAARALGFEFAFADASQQYESLRPQLNAAGFQPDLIYSNCFGRRDLGLSLQLVQEFRARIPMVQHFQDYEMDPQGESARVFRQLLPHCDAVWTLAGGIADDLKTRFGCSAEIINVLKGKVPPDFKREHRPADSSFRIVILGNVYYPVVFEDIRRLWHLAQTRLPGLQPIEWIGHPIQVQRCVTAKIDFEPEVKYVGFKDSLHEELLKADLAIVPFNCGASPENDYSRFSIPSRITELAFAGLPIFSIAGPGTEARHFIEHRGIGVCASPSEGELFLQRFLELLGDPELRAKLGLRARRVAEEEFDLEEYQSKLYDRLNDIAAKGGSRRQ